MATLRLSFIKANGETVLTFNVVGKKMSDSWIVKNYGKEWKEYYGNVYKCHKNEYGITWVSTMNGKYGVYQDYCVGGKMEKVIPCVAKFHFDIF